MRWCQISSDGVMAGDAVTVGPVIVVRLSLDDDVTDRQVGWHRDCGGGGSGQAWQRAARNKMGRNWAGKVAVKVRSHTAFQLRQLSSWLFSKLTRSTWPTSPELADSVYLSVNCFTGLDGRLKWAEGSALLWLAEVALILGHSIARRRPKSSRQLVF